MENPDPHITKLAQDLFVNEKQVKKKNSDPGGVLNLSPTEFFGSD